MKGHEPILDMRINGEFPEWVFINDFHCTDTDWVLFDDFATVCVVNDNIRNLDLRFLLGCKVSICSPLERRAKALLEACKPYADLVASAVVNEYGSQTKQAGWCEIWDRKGS